MPARGGGAALRRGLFVTGTDTGVGKTVVSAALLIRYGGELPLRYWKPIQTGVPPDDDTAEVRRLAAGAGGLLVPINRFALMADLIGRLELAAVVAARSTLGTINHTLLTLEALRARSLPVAGVVMVGDPDRDNREAITRYGGVDVLGELPRLDPLAPAALADWVRAGLDPGGRLRRWLA